MKKILISTVTLIGFASSAMAFEEGMDADNDGVLSEAEIVVAYPNITQEVFTAVDTNGDGSISIDEWTAATESGILE